jgi:hypothetical protein
LKGLSLFGLGRADLHSYDAKSMGSLNFCLVSKTHAEHQKPEPERQQRNAYHQVQRVGLGHVRNPTHRRQRNTSAQHKSVPLHSPNKKYKE